MKELLTCTKCERRWRREKTRGRKPVVCPKCVKAATKKAATPEKKTAVQVEQVKTKKPRAKRSVEAKPKVIAVNSTQEQDENSADLTVGKVYSIMHPKPANSEDLKKSTKGGSTWKCTSCKKVIKLILPVTAPPTHKCSDASKPKPCERVK